MDIFGRLGIITPEHPPLDLWSPPDALVDLSLPPDFGGGEPPPDPGGGEPPPPPSLPPSLPPP